MLIAGIVQTVFMKGKKDHPFKKLKKLQHPTSKSTKQMKTYQKNNLLWTDDQMQLYLDTAKSFKRKKLYDDGRDWEKEMINVCSATFEWFDYAFVSSKIAWRMRSTEKRRKHKVKLIVNIYQLLFYPCF